MLGFPDRIPPVPGDGDVCLKSDHNCMIESESS
jgi:hypothetical protein